MRSIADALTAATPGATAEASTMSRAHFPGKSRSHTPFPRPGKPDGGAKGGDPLVGSRHGRQGTESSVASLRLGRLWLSIVRITSTVAPTRERVCGSAPVGRLQ
jgi:hypothetical protein